MEADGESRLVRQWAHAAPALEAVRRAELRDMSDEEALRAVSDLLDLLTFAHLEAATSGLVEQQRLFSRLRQ
ncbi:MAG: hypothetical protein ACRDWW_04030 [Acidimicrobiales bacterium]